jgi:hypothetical protein
VAKDGDLSSVDFGLIAKVWQVFAQEFLLLFNCGADLLDDSFDFGLPNF